MRNTFHIRNAFNIRNVVEMYTRRRVRCDEGNGRGVMDQTSLDTRDAETARALFQAE